MKRRNKIEIDRPKIRRTWDRDPSTRVKDPTKGYNRKRDKLVEVDTEKEELEEQQNKRTFQYCPYCTTPLEKRYSDDRERWTCPDCGFIWYNNPVPACGGVVLKDGEVLLVKRKYEPRKGGWTLPAGFMENDEGPEACTIREMEEETGLKVEIKGLFGVYEAGDDPRTKVVLILYYVDIVGGQLNPGDDACEIGHFSYERLPTNIAFKAHRRALSKLFGKPV